ncbi:MAG: hypothetical protein C4519_20850 [Desulfobacteraceae bacterium]|nr:MAG: hypothetical protein C4519_20850 [Desulfobacteraceae bacterium]
MAYPIFLNFIFNMGHRMVLKGILQESRSHYQKQYDYILPGIGLVEVFIDREQATPEQVQSIQQNLSLRPAAVSYLQILLDHPVIVKIHGVHKSIKPRICRKKMCSTSSKPLPGNPGSDFKWTDQAISGNNGDHRLSRPPQIFPQAFRPIENPRLI